MPGPTWKPLTSCEGDYLRFYSPPIPSVTREGAQDRLQRWHWKKRKLFSFTFKLKRWLWERSDSITLTDLTSASAGRRRPTSLLAWRTNFLFSLGGENKFFDVFLNFLFIKLSRTNLELDLIRWLKICFMRINCWTFFRSDRKFRARGFNCTVTCEEFDFSDLFSRFIFFVRYVVKW